MKKFLTTTHFSPLSYEDGKGFSHVMGKDGKKKMFKTRAGAEGYCKKHRCAYVEEKYIFYR